MIVGIGTDIVQIERISSVLERLGERFAARILTPAGWSVGSSRGQQRHG